MRPTALLLAAALLAACDGGSSYPTASEYDCSRTIECPGAAPVTEPLGRPICSATPEDADRFTCLVELAPGCTCTSSCAATGACD